MALAAISNAQDADHKIVFQMTTDNPKEHKALMNNLRNLREGWGDTVQMLVVVHSPGVALVDAKNPFAEEIQQFIKEKEVVFAVCENTLKQKNIDKASLMPNLEFVPMGVAEIVTKQEQGWSYIKANF
jgi:hypothetical protein